MAEKLRVGIVDYLNSKPLAWSFLTGEFDGRFEPIFESPARVASLLAAGQIDIGLIPSIEYQRIQGLSILPRLCVGAEREVRSVILVSSVDVRAIRTLALDQNSRTSAALVRIILGDRYGLEVETAPAPPDLASMLAANDAALLIGDPALRVDLGGMEVLDLAREWRLLTGHPFVFAVWAVRGGVVTDGLAELFEHSLAAGLDNIETLVAGAADDLGIDRESIREYLTENLHFRLGEAELAGLTEYYHRAHQHGLIDSVEPLRLL
ncbi:MAG: menaquinone biosynthesis protein [Acidobacteriota bacterium]|nr:menaquinone biosynthesis protein [Acidobacteriota bacterium]